MDVKIRFWSDDKLQVTTCYHDSNSLTCENAENIRNVLVERMDKLCNKNCIMLLMDGSNFNWSILDKISSQRKQMDLLCFFEVGCCGLHAVHGAFGPGSM